METRRLGDRENMRRMGTKNSKQELPADLFGSSLAFTAFIKLAPSRAESYAGIMSNPFGSSPLKGED